MNVLRSFAAEVTGASCCNPNEDRNQYLIICFTPKSVSLLPVVFPPYLSSSQFALSSILICPFSITSQILLKRTWIDCKRLFGFLFMSRPTPRFPPYSQKSIDVSANGGTTHGVPQTSHCTPINTKPEIQGCAQPNCHFPPTRHPQHIGVPHLAATWPGYI